MGAPGRPAALAAAFFLAALAAAPGAAAAGETRGLFVGVGRYKARALDSLDYPAEDARSVARAFERAGVSADRRVVLVDRAATRRAVLDALDSLAGRTGPDDLLVVYVSGHGFRGDEPGDPAEADGLDEFLAPYDSRSEGTERDISDDLLAERLGAARGRVLLVLDACHAGGFSGDLRGLPRVTALLACREDEEASEDPVSRRSLFTRFLLAGLDGAADSDGDGEVDAVEIAAYLRGIEALKEARQSPVFVIPEPALPILPAGRD